MRATITSKGQITIPAEIRRKLGLTTGTVLEFEENSDRVVASKRVDRNKMKSVIGIAEKQLSGKSSLEWLEELRGPAELPRK